MSLREMHWCVVYVKYDPQRLPKIVLGNVDANQLFNAENEFIEVEAQVFERGVWRSVNMQFHKSQVQVVLLRPFHEISFDPESLISFERIIKQGWS